MKAGRIFGRNQQKKQMGGLSVERLEIDPLQMPPEDSEDAVYAANLAVMYRDSVADRGRAQPFPFGQHRRERLDVKVAILRGKASRQFPQHFRLVPSAKVGQHKFRAQNFGDLHGSGTIQSGPMVVPSASLNTSPVEGARTLLALTLPRWLL